MYRLKKILKNLSKNSTEDITYYGCEAIIRKAGWYPKIFGIKAHFQHGGAWLLNDPLIDIHKVKYSHLPFITFQEELKEKWVKDNKSKSLVIPHPISFNLKTKFFSKKGNKSIALFTHTYYSEWRNKELSVNSSNIERITGYIYNNKVLKYHLYNAKLLESHSGEISVSLTSHDYFPEIINIYQNKGLIVLEPLNILDEKYLSKITDRFIYFDRVIINEVSLSGAYIAHRLGIEIKYWPMITNFWGEDFNGFTKERQQEDKKLNMLFLESPSEAFNMYYSKKNWSVVERAKLCSFLYKTFVQHIAVGLFSKRLKSL